jgi:hypothetical protein
LSRTILEHKWKGLISRAHKWRKAWVAPTGSQPEASYKICRYVKVGKDDKVRFFLTQWCLERNQADDQDVEDETNGDEEDDDEGEGEGEGEEDEEEDGDEEEGDEKVVATPAADTPAGTEQAVGESTAPTPAAPAPSSDPAPESTPPTLPTTSTETPSTAEHQIPSNAIELTNTTPNHVADGSITTGGIELTQSHDQPSSNVEPTSTVVGSLGQNEEKMEVDSPIIEKGEAVEEDVGLVMGEMTPPVGQKELELEKTELDTVKETESAPVGQVVEEQKSEEIKVDEKTGEVVTEQPPALE